MLGLFDELLTGAPPEPFIAAALDADDASMGGQREARHRHRTAECIEKYAEGFDKLAAHVADKTPDWAYPITGIKPDLVAPAELADSSGPPHHLVRR